MKKLATLLTMAVALVLAAACNKEARPAEVIGTVSYDGRAINGVVVTYTGENDTYEYTTERDGNYILRNVTPGDYIVSCTYNGKSIVISLDNYEKAENPLLVTVEDNGYHLRNISISLSEDIDGDEDDDDESDSEE